MHMADALVSPAVGGTMWAVSAGLIGYCSNKAKTHLDDKTTPLMGVLGAFIFAAQMINFAIPATGSSGHLGGGLLLAILLGPWAAFLTLSSILTVQSLFFADGGILALGCNIFNIGFFPCMIAYPLVYRPIVSGSATRVRIFAGSIIASVIGLQLGSLGVVLETTLSGITELPLSTFALFMQPIHLAIGLVEGVATASIVLFLYAARPDIMHSVYDRRHGAKKNTSAVLQTFALAAVFLGAFVSLSASTLPDGLEWSIFKTAGQSEVGNDPAELHSALAKIQKNSAILPDYTFRDSEHNTQKPTSSYPDLHSDKVGSTLSGLVGTGLFLLFATCVSFLFRLRRTVS